MAKKDNSAAKKPRMLTPELKSKQKWSYRSTSLRGGVDSTALGETTCISWKCSVGELVLIKKEIKEKNKDVLEEMTLAK